MIDCPWKIPPSSTTRVFGDVAVHAPAPGELGPPLDEDGALEPAGHHDVLRVDVRLDLALRREQDVALRVDLALTCPSIRSDPADTTVPSSLAPVPRW